MFGKQKAGFVLVKCWICQRLDCLQRAQVIFKWCIIYFACTLIAFFEQSRLPHALNEGLFWTWDCIRARAGDSESLYLHFTAISQVYLGVKVGRVSSNFFSLHSSHSCLPLCWILNCSSWPALRRSFEFSVCFNQHLLAHGYRGSFVLHLQSGSYFSSNRGASLVYDPLHCCALSPNAVSALPVAASQ